MASMMERRLAAKEAMIPAQGYNLVGLDDFEREPEDELFLVGNYPSREEAEKELDERKKKDPDAVYYVYGPGMR